MTYSIALHCDKETVFETWEGTFFASIALKSSKTEEEAANLFIRDVRTAENLLIAANEILKIMKRREKEDAEGIPVSVRAENLP